MTRLFIESAEGVDLIDDQITTLPTQGDLDLDPNVFIPSVRSIQSERLLQVFRIDRNRRAAVWQ